MGVFIWIMAFLLLTGHLTAQERWQQKVKYKMDVNLDVRTNILKGKQTIEYSNNSPDTLKVLYYHLYWNAFQPNSMMDVRNRELGKRLLNGRNDWEARVADRISRLKPEETGYQKMSGLKMNGRPQKTELHETILKVILDKPVLPRTKVLLEADFEAQVNVLMPEGGVFPGAASYLETMYRRLLTV